jgi:hypothetical protein
VPGGFADGARKQDVIGIQPGHDFTARDAKAFVDGVRLPAIRF